ncbi:MAG TPA: acyltransferase [Caulobacter sp.]|nr:acyltransferase [Caulobacter sp.]
MLPRDRTWVSIQHMRALAALSVVMFHASQWARINFDIGAAGVDVFFVISGFVMWTVTAGGKVAPLNFVRRRVVRVAPLYWLTTLVLVAGALVFPSRFPEVDPDVGHVALSLAFIQHLNPDGLPFPVLTPGWSLNYEAVFYLVFAACLILPERSRLLALTMALATLSLAGFVWPAGYVMLLNPLFLQFLAGAWLGRLAQEKLLPDRTFGWVMLGIGQALFIVLWLSRIDPDLWRPMIWGAPALLVVAGVVTVEADGGWPRWRWLGALGDASYALYLTHTLAIGALAMTLGAWNAPLFIPMAVALAVLVGLLTHWFVEKPLLVTLRQRLA